jgi:plasmid maintenance system killer protein
MIVSYRDRKTEHFANGQPVKEFSGFARQAEIRLDRLEAACSLKDLGALRGNRLEASMVTGRDNTVSASMTNGGFALNGPKDRPARSMSRLLITTRKGRRHAMARTPIHPGEHLAEELRELDISAAELARQIDVPVNRVRNHQWPARHHGGHGAASWRLVWHQPGVLAEPSKAL